MKKKKYILWRVSTLELSCNNTGTIVVRNSLTTDGTGAIAYASTSYSRFQTSESSRSSSLILPKQVDMAITVPNPKHGAA